MNIFNVQVKNSNGEFVSINGRAVRPFSWGELLDERLDEAYLHIVGDTTPYYKPLTEFKITLSDNKASTDDKTLYMIVASDHSEEKPVGSGRYKHELYLIERTKMLEGVICPTLTFTNVLGNIYTNNSRKALNVDLSNEYDYSTELPADFIPSINSVILAGVPANLPSAQSLANEMLPYVRASMSDDTVVNVSNGARVGNPQVEASMISYISKCEYFDGNTTTTYKFDELVNPHTSSGSITLTYTLCYSYYSYINGIKYDTYYKAYFVRYNISCVYNYFPTKPWTITDCVNRVLICAEPLKVSQSPRFKFNAEQAEKYSKILAPEFTITQSTLREALKVIGGYIHGEPWLDENDEIHFKEYGETKRSPLENAPYALQTAATDINEYCTEIRSYAQNLVSSLGYARGVIMEPGKDLYKSLRAETSYARISAENGLATTELPIYSIEKVMCGIVDNRYITGEDTSVNPYYLNPVDITPYVFEETEYNGNLSSYEGGYPYSKSYAIYYTQGSKNLKGLFFKAPDRLNTDVFGNYAISNILSACSSELSREEIKASVETNPENLVFLISYKAISSAMVSHGKQLYISGETPYTQIYNQSENLVETQFYGEHIKGVAARLGNVERTRTYLFKNHSNLPEIGQLMRIGGEDYAISAVSCEQNVEHIKCTVGLSKDFNRISQYVGINSMKRMYEVSERMAQQRNLHIKEYWVVGRNASNRDYIKMSRILLGENDNFDAIYHTFVPETANRKDYKLTNAVFKGASDAAFKKPVGEEVLLPVIPCSLGNTMTFAFSFKDNYSAGGTTVDGEYDGGVKGKWIGDTRYTDYYGRCMWCKFGFLNTTKNSASRFYEYKAAYTLPKITDFGDYIVDFDYIPPIKLYKDNREIITVSAEIEIKTTEPDIIIGSGFAEECRLVSDYTGAFELYFIGSPERLTKFDKYFTPEAPDVEGTFYSADTIPLLFTNDEDDKYLKFQESDSYKAPKDCYGWVVCTKVEEETNQYSDEDGDTVSFTTQKGGKIILASTKEYKKGENVFKDLCIYFKEK